jgi:5'-nucleotidase
MAIPLIDWSAIDHVLLDMDGTVLDLAYDNHFWLHHVPQRYAERHGVTLEESLARLQPEFHAAQGTLNWYCLDYWSALTELDIVALKTELKHRIGLLPGSEDFLNAVRATGRDLWLVTNAHPGSWRLKLDETGLHGHFDRIISAHDIGAPKEDPRFWPALQAQHAFDAQRALFVDDSLPVLRAAQNYGILHVVAISHPDSSASRRDIAEFPAVDRLVQLLPIAA